MIGIGLVVLLHVFLVYALVSGLASSAIDVIKKPLEIKIIQAPPPPPPPPEIIKPPPPPAMVTPPPPYIPPPLIQLQQPPPPPPIAVVTTVKPVAPTKMTPPAPPGPAPPSTAVGEVCPNIGSVGGQLEDSFQQIADNEGLSESHVTVEFTVSPAGVISGAHRLLRCALAQCARPAGRHERFAMQRSEPDGERAGALRFRAQLNFSDPRSPTHDGES